MTPYSFKVLIVGGGPVGLVAALTLRSAGIDFVILERRPSIVADVGAGITLKPPTLRIFHQLRLLEKLLPLGCELRERSTFTLRGHLFDSDAFTYMKKSHGCSLYGYHRAELVQFLYDALHEDHHRILVGKQLTNIIHKDDGVQAICGDGTSYTGSVILGADGVHSQTRKLMRELALQANAGPEWAAEKPFPATYKCLFFSTPLLSPKGHFVDTESKGRCIFYLVGQDRAWVFLCETLPQPTTERAVYSADDAAEFAAQFAEFPLTSALKVKDVYPLAQSSSMVNLEEGFANQWSWGRVVLAGDSCHKFTPHAGQGFNCGVQDAVVLTNVLRQAIASSPERNPTAQELKVAFESYQTLRTPYARVDEVVSATIARLFSWATLFYRILACYVFPLRLCDYLFYSRISPNGMRYAAVLDHIAAKEPFTGTVEWEQQMTGAVS